MIRLPMKHGDGKRGKRLVIVLVSLGLAGAIAALLFSRHRDYIPSTQPSPLQSIW